MFSIVMPSYNQAAFIGEAIDSIFLQDCDLPVELIVYDGVSTDGTQGILESKSHLYPNLRWVSEPDNGPADAINKALSATLGTYIGWLNSDDMYMPDTLRTVREYYKQNPETALTYGQGMHVDSTGENASLYPTLKPDVGVSAFRDGSFICQPTVFFKRSTYFLMGGLDASFKAAFDYDYWIRAFQLFPGRIGFIDQVLAKSRLHMECITQRNRQLVAEEGARAVAKHFGHAPIHWLVTYIEEELADLNASERAIKKQIIMNDIQNLSSYFELGDINKIITQF